MSGSSTTTVGDVGSGYCCAAVGRDRSGGGGNPWSSRDTVGTYTMIGSTYRGSGVGAVSVGSGVSTSYPGAFVVGVGFNGYTGAGYEGSAGFYAGEGAGGNSDAGSFVSWGGGTGIGLGFDAFFGYFIDGPSAVKGETINKNYSISYYGISIFEDPATGSIIGFTINMGISVPGINISRASATTETYSFGNLFKQVTPKP